MQLSPAEYIIHVFGGVRATARALNRTPSTISKWIHRKYIPPNNIETILKKAEEMSLDINPEDIVLGRNVKMNEL